MSDLFFIGVIMMLVGTNILSLWVARDRTLELLGLMRSLATRVSKNADTYNHHMSEMHEVSNSEWIMTDDGTVWM